MQDIECAIAGGYGVASFFKAYDAEKPEGRM